MCACTFGRCKEYDYLKTGGYRMWIADKYIDYVKEQTVEHPGESWEKMLLGFKANKLRTKLLPKKGISKGYQKLEAMMMSFVSDSLDSSSSLLSGNSSELF